MDGELVRLTGTEWAVLDCLWEASPQTMTQLARTLAEREGGPRAPPPPCSSG